MNLLNIRTKQVIVQCMNGKPLSFRPGKAFLWVILLALPSLAFAQILTIRQAMDTALQNNLDLRLVRNDFEVARFNNTAANAGALPLIGASASNVLSGNGTSRTYRDNTPDVETRVADNTLQAGVTAGMTLFNGYKVAATKKRLDLLQQQSETYTNQQIQTTLANVALKYYDIVRQESYYRIMQQLLDVSQSRQLIVNRRKQVGMANAMDELMARTDENTARQNLRMQQTVIRQAKSDLKLLMAVPPDRVLTVDTLIVPDSTLLLSNTLTRIRQNPGYVAMGQTIQMDEQKLLEIKAQRYPAIKLNAGYSFLNQYNFNGNALQYRNWGPDAGVSMQVPLYNGHLYRTQVQVARLTADNSRIEQQQFLNTLITQAIKLHDSYGAALEEARMQAENYRLTLQLVGVVMERFRMNQATILEVKSAQSSFESAAYQLINSLYTAKVAEIGIKQLTDSLP